MIYDLYDTLVEYLSKQNMPNGYHSIVLANGEKMDLEVVNYSNFVATSTVHIDNIYSECFVGDFTNDKTTLVIICESMHIPELVRLRPLKRKKGMVILVRNTLRLDGEISMTARGAVAKGQTILLSPNKDGTYEFIPAIGGLGARGVKMSTLGRNSIKGENGANRSTGGGSSGTAMFTIPYIFEQCCGGNGGNGTSYSGGAGGASVRSHSHCSDADHFGGIGGSNTGSAFGVGGFGGTGNPGGNGYIARGNTGTGGLLVIYSRHIEVGPNGKLTANGVSGVGTKVNGSGGSGGGSINLFYCSKNMDVPHECFGVGVNPGGDGSFTESLIDAEMLSNHTTLNVTYTVMLENESQLPSIASIGHSTDLHSTANFRAFSWMDVKYRVQQPPINTEVISCIMDTYTNEGRPTLNYGTRQSLACGTKDGYKNYIYLYFDITRIAQLLEKDSLLTKFDLVLTLPVKCSSKLELEFVYEEWEEYSITWKTSFSTYRITSYEFKDSSSVSIDLYKWLTEHKNSKILNIRIKSSNFISVYSRESHFSPKLLIEWKDLSWTGNNSDNSFYSTATIKKSDNRDLSSNVSLIQFTSLLSSAEIELPVFNLDSIAWVRGFYVKDIQSTAKFKPIELNFASTANIRNKESADLSSVFNNNTSNLQTIATIKKVKDLESNAIISLNKSMELFSTANILNMLLPSTAEFKNITDLYSTAFFKANYSQDLLSTAHFPNMLLRSTAVLNQVTGIYSEAFIRRTDSAGLESVASIYSDNMLHNLVSRAIVGKIKYTQADLSSTVTIRRNDVRTLHSIVSIFRENTSILPAKAEFDYANNLFISDATIIRSDTTGINSSAEFKLIDNDLYAVADIYKIHEMYSEAIIKQFDISELESTALISLGDYPVNLSSVVFIRRKSLKNLHSRAEIRSSARKWIPNIHAPKIFNYNRKLPRQR